MKIISFRSILKAVSLLLLAMKFKKLLSISYFNYISKHSSYYYLPSLLKNTFIDSFFLWSIDKIKDSLLGRLQDALKFFPLKLYEPINSPLLLIFIIKKDLFILFNILLVLLLASNFWKKCRFSEKERAK